MKYLHDFGWELMSIEFDNNLKDVSILKKYYQFWGWLVQKVMFSIFDLLLEGFDEEKLVTYKMICYNYGCLIYYKES